MQITVARTKFNNNNISMVVFCYVVGRERRMFFFVPVENSACGGSKFQPKVDWIGSARSKRHTHTHPLITHATEGAL